MKNAIIILSLLLSAQICYCIPNIPDSISQQYKSLKNDSNRTEYIINQVARYKGNYPKLAFEMAEKALFYAEQANYIQGMCRAYNYLGSIKCDIGEYLAAVQYHEKAFERAKFLNDETLLSETYNYMGNVAYAQKKYTKAIEYYKESLKYSEKNNFSTQTLNNLYKLGLIYETLDNLNDAYRCYKRSLLIEEEIKNKEGMFFSFMGIASVSMKRGNYYQAYVLYNKAKDIAENLNILSYISLVYSKLGDLSKIQKKYVDALNYYTTALKIADSLEFYKDKRDCYYNLAYTNEKLQFYKEAYNNLTRYVEINDTLYNTEISEQVARMQMRFDLKTKEKDIEYLRQKEEQRTKERNFMIIGALFLTVILILLAIIFRIRQKSAKKVKRQYDEIKTKQAELNTAIEQLNELNHELKHTNDQITDSLIYAASLQQMLLPYETQFKTHVANSFIFNKPKYLVSGDFAWVFETPQYLYFAVADCTGHGLAGALVSIKGYSLLNNIILSKPTILPGEALTWLHKNWHPLHGKNSEDSMEVSLCRIEKNSLAMDYSTTNQRFAIISNLGDEHILSNNIMSVGHTIFNLGDDFCFKTDSTQINTGDTIYLFTDGFSDQFGKGNQKLMFNAFLEQLKSLSKYPLSKQNEILKNFFENWKGNNEQTDDVLIIGIQF